MPSLEVPVSKSTKMCCNSLSVTPPSLRAEPETRDASTTLYLILMPQGGAAREAIAAPSYRKRELRHQGRQDKSNYLTGREIPFQLWGPPLILRESPSSPLGFPARRSSDRASRNEGEERMVHSFLSLQFL